MLAMVIAPQHACVGAGVITIIIIIITLVVVVTLQHVCVLALGWCQLLMGGDSD